MYIFRPIKERAKEEEKKTTKKKKRNSRVSNGQYEKKIGRDTYPTQIIWFGTIKHFSLGLGNSLAYFFSTHFF